MILIQRQDVLVAQLEQIYSEHLKRGRAAFGQDIIGRRSRAKRLHREELAAAGYSPKEASESAEQCDQVAFRNAEFLATMVAA
nr:hypothetical protein [uncultured Roseateles sp.]